MARLKQRTGDNIGLSYTEPYITVFLDPDNPDGDQIAFICTNEKWKKVASFLFDNCESVTPE